MKLQPLLMITGALLAVIPAVAAVTAETVPWDPTNLTSPHTVVAGTTATLAATVNLGGSADSFTYSWNYGDGSAPSSPLPVIKTGTSVTVGNMWNLSATHLYPVTTGVNYTAVLTVTDTTNPATYTGNYYLIVQPNTLQWTVNQAIDGGLWYLHTTMDRANTTNAGSVVVAWGGWDGQLGNGCLGSYNCLDSGGLDATNVQAFEVSGHYENGIATDPYTDDVARGLARVMYFVGAYKTNVAGSKVISYNPAVMAARCSDGSQPTGAGYNTCPAGTTLIQYNPGATSCKATPCTFTYDGNSNGQMDFEANDGEGDPGYQTGMLVTAIVASQNPAGVTRTGVAAASGLPGVLGQTYLNVVQDLVDGIGYCQYYADDENTAGYDNGGGWEYGCAGTSSDASWYDDNSPSQWNAIAMIAANRAFGIAVPPVVTDTNQVWVTWSQDTTSANKGEFGYDEWDYEPWGPYAMTPSGLVQLAMDGVGRTAAGAADQRWNLTENYYRNNFCNAVSGGATVAPRAYTYGMFSFTKSMEEHDPGGVLTPITLLANQPGNTNQLDWYNAQASAGATCDGVAQTLVSRQGYSGVTTSKLTAANAWYGADYEYPQTEFETAWSIIMLQKTSFVACVNSLGGAAKASSRSSGALVTLSWSGIADAASYTVQRSTTTGGPYTTVGNTTGLAFNDQTAGLVNGDSYYYVLQPDNASGTAVCTSNQATVSIP